MDKKPGKKTMGRRKIEMKKIEKKNSLQVTFSKRRASLFRKASELSLLCGTEIAILVMSPANKIFAFGNPCVDSVLQRFQTGEMLPPEIGKVFLTEDSKNKFAEAEKRLAWEKKTQKTDCFWWEELPPLEGMELQELEELVQGLEGLRDNVMHRAEEMQKLMISNLLDYNSASSSNLLDFSNPEGVEYNYYSGGLNQGTQFHNHDHQDFINGGISSFNYPNQGLMMEVNACMENGSISTTPTASDLSSYNNFMTNPIDDDDDQIFNAASDRNYSSIFNITDPTDLQSLMEDPSILSTTFNS